MIKNAVIQQISWCFLLLLISSSVSAQLVLRIESLPTSTPAGSSIYAAGSFNNWDPSNSDYILSQQQGLLEISLTLTPGTYEYKFTRGDWPTVEGSVDGGFRPNRSITYNGGEQIEVVTIDGWEDQAGANSTAAANVQVLSQDFYIPQLNRNRRVLIYLPPDYATSNRSYPVMYMHDGQNLFDAATSFSGEWEVDESLNRLFDDGDPGIIIVGIDNGGADRLNEYTPWANPSYGGGQGSEYVDFLVETLKPHVDANYRTLSDANHTGIMGSSLGGLISLYAGIRHQDVFGKIGVLSPSLWFTDDIYTFVNTTGRQASVRIALLAGEQESATMVTELNSMYSTLRDAGFAEAELSLITHPDGTHSEWYWRREFPSTYEWLFDNITPVRSSPELEQVQIWPNPSRDFLHIGELPISSSHWTSTIYNLRGQLIQRDSLQQNQVQVNQLPSGSYFLYLHDDQNRWALLRFQKI